MDKIGRTGSTSVPSTKSSTIGSSQVVSPQDKKVTFTGQQVQEQKQVQQKQEKPDQKNQQVKDKTPANQGNFQVITGKDGKVGIKLTNISQNISFGKLSTKELGAHLAKLNMPMTDENINLAKALLKFKMPVNMENLQDVKGALAMMTQKTDGDAQAGVFMKLKSMGVTPENAKALQTLFAKNPDIGNQLDQLQKMAKYFSALGQSGMGDSALLSLMGHVAQMFGEMIAEPHKGEKKLTKKLKDMAEEVGVEGDEGAGKTGKSNKGSAKGNLGKLKKKLNDKISTLKDYTAKEQEEMLKKTKKLVDELDENLEAQRLINNSPSVDDDNFIYLQVPVKMANGNTVALHIKLEYEYDSEGRKIVNPKKTKLEFSIKTEDMGIINIIMNIWKRKISLQVEAQNQDIKNHINKNAPDFINKLKDKAYKVVDWDCVVNNKPVSFPQNLLSEEETFNELATLDVTI